MFIKLKGNPNVFGGRTWSSGGALTQLGRSKEGILEEVTIRDLKDKWGHLDWSGERVVGRAL